MGLLDWFRRKAETPKPLVREKTEQAPPKEAETPAPEKQITAPPVHEEPTPAPEEVPTETTERREPPSTDEAKPPETKVKKGAPRVEEKTKKELDQQLLVPGMLSYKATTSQPREEAPPTASAKDYINDGVASYQKESYQDALNKFKMATQADPNTAAAWSNMGCALGKLGDCEAALKAFDKALEIEPENQMAKEGKELCLKLLNPNSA